MKELWISTQTGKMTGLRSVSSSCLCNNHCKARSKNPKTICAHCYAHGYLDFRNTLKKHLTDNYEWLQKLHQLEEFPKTTGDKYFRLESFGDVASINHARNFLRFAKANPKTTFAAWTKNLGYYKQAIALEKKPANLILIFSSPFVGKTKTMSEENLDIVDHLFTVMPKDTPEEKINCGARSCLGCLKCYRKCNAKNPFLIYERLK